MRGGASLGHSSHRKVLDLQAVPQGNRGCLRFERDNCRKASRNARDRAQRAALGAASGPRPTPKTLDVGPAAVHRSQQIDWHVEQVVNAARAVESNVWPEPIGEDGQRALSCVVMRLLDLHRAVQEARRVIAEMQGKREGTEER
jgi:hypothetical protein